MQGFQHAKFGSNNVLVVPSKEGWFALDSIDLTGVRSADISIGWQQTPGVALEFEIRQDSPSGKLLGKGRMPVPAKNQKAGTAEVSISPVRDGKYHTVYFIFKPGSKELENRVGVGAVEFRSR